MAYDVDALSHPTEARQFLKEQLPQNHLALFLGAGVSMAAGLPNWRTLTRRIALLARIERKEVSRYLGAEKYVELADEAERRHGNGEGFRLSVQRALYSRFRRTALEICQTPILLGLGSLVTGGRRGRIVDIVSLNFDDLLEFYLSLHGHEVCSVSSLPTLLDAEAIQITHVHGFLPYLTNETDVSDFLILSRKSANTVLGEKDNLFRIQMEAILLSKICLFVGMSEKTATDYLLSTLLQSTAFKVRGERPVGFWFFRRPENQEVIGQLRDYNVPAVYFDKYEEIAMFLLSVCEEAGGDLRTSLIPRLS